MLGCRRSETWRRATMRAFPARWLRLGLARSDCSASDRIGNPFGSHGVHNRRLPQIAATHINNKYLTYLAPDRIPTGHWPASGHVLIGNGEDCAMAMSFQPVH